MQWYYKREGAEFGPVSQSELQRLAMQAVILPDDLIREDGSEAWVTARSHLSEFGGKIEEPLILEADPEMSLVDRMPPVRRPVLERERQKENRDRDVGRDRGRERDDHRDRGRDRVRDDDRERGRERERDEYDDRDRDDWADRRGGNDLFSTILLFVKRAFSTDLRNLPVTDEEAKTLKRANITSECAQHYAVWRRSLLWFVLIPSSFAALFHLITLMAMDKTESDQFTRIGMGLQYLQALSLFAIPVTALIATLSYDRLHRSSIVLLIGMLIAFVTPILIALVPAEHLIDLKGGGDEARMGAGFIFGFMFYLTLLPTILSLLPATSRACIKLKSLLPTSIVPGWGFIASAPLFVLIGFATFILIYHIAGNFLLIFGVLLWIAAPMIYLARWPLLVHPLTRSKEFRQVAKLNTFVLATVLTGVVLIIIFLFTAKLGGKYIVGTDKLTSLMRPWNIDLHARWIEFVGKSLFMTVVFLDLIMLMNLSVWNQEKDFYRTERAADYDRDMNDLAAAVAPPPRKRYRDDEEDYDDRDRDDDRDRKRDRDDRR